MSHTKVREEAIGYLLAHQNEHLTHDRNLLVSRCAAFLQARFGLNDDRANVISLQAIGEIDARATNVHIDMERSTSFAVFVVDPVTGIRSVFTAGDLVRLARSNLPLRCGAVH